MDAVKTEKRPNGVFIIALNKPKSGNALDEDIHAGLTRALEQANTDNEIRAVILHGEGKVFIAGADRKLYHSQRNQPIQHSRRHRSRPQGHTYEENHGQMARPPLSRRKLQKTSHWGRPRYGSWRRC